MTSGLVSLHVNKQKFNLIVVIVVRFSLPTFQSCLQFLDNSILITTFKLVYVDDIRGVVLK
jgi:hypothetical protein